jgi:hypothetical protein
LILDLIAALPDGAAAARVAASDWPRAIERARFHGVAPMLDFVLRQSGASIPPVFADALHEAADEAALLSTRVRSTLRRSLRCAREASIPVIVLKGWPFAARHYPSSELRSMADVDLLVMPGDAARLVKALHAVGGRETASIATQRYHQEHHHHWPPIAGVGPAVVEVHHRALTGFGSTIESQPLFERASLDEFEDLPFMRPALEDELVYLASHGAGHLFERLSWLLDLKLLVGRSSVDWSMVRDRASSWGFGGAVDFSIALLQRVGAPVPSRRSRLLPNTLAKLESALESASYIDHRRLGMLAMMALADTPRRAARYFLHNLGRAARRRAAKHAPSLVPADWGG